MSGTGYLRFRPTEIRPTAAEYLSRADLNQALTGWKIYKTNWTRAMLERLQAFSRSHLKDDEILELLREDFAGAPETAAEIRQELAFMGMGPRKDACWTQDMEETVSELYEQGFDAQDLTVVLMRRFKRPSDWTETYRKIQEFKMAGVFG
ncbi:MAG: hypothetical protein Q9208_003125 [Pyrenodesmia sp. 3 TL-2023]